MQETRRVILEILRQNSGSTVDDLVNELRRRRSDNITAVTVRHHLNELLKDDLITMPQLRHRSSPGRPQHIYTLTDKAKTLFPSNYQALAQHLIHQLSQQLPTGGVNVIFDGIADQMAAQAGICDLPMPERLKQAVLYLNQQGYDARWEDHQDGYILHTCNCPYHQLAGEDKSLCQMDFRLIANLVGTVPQLMSRLSEGDSSCSYFIPHPPNQFQGTTVLSKGVSGARKSSSALENERRKRSKR